MYFRNFFTNYHIWFMLVVALAVRSETVIKRNLTSSINPGCDIKECKYPYSILIVHVEAVGPKDTIHYLWSTYKFPCMIVAQTSHDSSLNINWTSIKTFEIGAISFSDPAEQSTALLLTNVWEIPGKNEETSAEALNITLYKWDILNETAKFSPEFVTAVAQVSSSDDNIFSHNGSFGIQFSVSGKDKASDHFPHLHFTANSTEMNLLLKDLTPENPRFGAEFMSISSAKDKTLWKPQKFESVNDEYSPGVFTAHNLETSCENNHINCKSFQMWKPVAYLGEKPSVANSSDATVSDFIKVNATISQNIASVYFAAMESKVSRIMWNITFGGGDDYYNKTRYMSWSVMIGTGQPFIDKISVLAIIMIAVGLGTPIFIMLIGAVYLIFKRYRRNDDDDLLLES